MGVQGGLFDGQWEAGLGELVVDLTGAVGDTLLEFWRQNLDDDIKVNEGRYISETRVTRVSDDQVVLGDGESKYGPWLEGQGSRNAPVTRFAGYHAAEHATDSVNATFAEIGDPAVAKFVEEMNA